MDHKEDRPWLSSIVQLRYHQNAVCAYSGEATYLNNRLWYGPAAGVSGAGPLACARASLGAARAVAPRTARQSWPRRFAATKIELRQFL